MRKKVAVGEVNIDGGFRVFVVKQMILFRIEDLEEGGNGEFFRLIGFIQDEHAVHGLHLDQPLDDGPGLGAFIGEAVSAHIRFIAHAAQGNLVAGDAEILGNRDGKGGLANPRRAHQQEGTAGSLPGPGLVLVETAVAPDEI